MPLVFRPMLLALADYGYSLKPFYKVLAPPFFFTKKKQLKSPNLAKEEKALTHEVAAAANKIK